MGMTSVLPIAQHDDTDYVDVGALKVPTSKELAEQENNYKIVKIAKLLIPPMAMMAFGGPATLSCSGFLASVTKVVLVSEGSQACLRAYLSNRLLSS
jgi:hypothetical protein